MTKIVKIKNILTNCKIKSKNNCYVGGYYNSQGSAW